MVLNFQIKRKSKKEYDAPVTSSMIPRILDADDIVIISFDDGRKVERILTIGVMRELAEIFYKCVMAEDEIRFSEYHGTRITAFSGDMTEDPGYALYVLSGFMCQALCAAANIDNKMIMAAELARQTEQIADFLMSDEYYFYL